MKLSPTFYVITGIALVCFVPAYLAMRSDSAALEAQAKSAAVGVAGYDTLEEQSQKRHEQFVESLHEIRRRADEEIEKQKHEHEMWKLRRELEDARADNEASRKSREAIKAMRSQQP